MEEIRKLRAQLSSIAETNFQNAEVRFNTNIRPPKDTQVSGVLSCILTLVTSIRLDQSYPSTACRGIY